MPFDGRGFGDSFEALDKIDKVINLLAREDRWCKQQLRTYDGRRCILGAMMDADATLVLMGPILLAIEQVTCCDYSKVEVFNDSPSTSHALVLRVLRQARDNILSARGASPVASSRPWTGMLRPWSRLEHLFA